MPHFQVSVHYNHLTANRGKSTASLVFSTPPNTQKYVFFRIFALVIALIICYTSDGRKIPNRPNTI